MKELVQLVNRIKAPYIPPVDPREQIEKAYYKIETDWLLEDYLEYIMLYYEIYAETFYREHPPLTDREMKGVMENLAESGRLQEKAIRYYMINCFWESCDIREFSKQSADYIFNAWIRDYQRRPLV